MSEEDYSSLPLADRLVHKVWKVRLGAYEELGSLFSKSPNEQAECFAQYSQPDLWRKVVTDSNVVAQEQGIAALAAFLEYGGAHAADSTRLAVVAPLAEKGLALARAGTKTATTNALLWYVELGEPLPVVEDLIPLLGHRMPKLVAGVAHALVEVYLQFGAKTAPPQPVLAVLPKLFGHADKNVRAEAVLLLVVLHRWMGDAFQLVIFSELKPVQQKDLTAAFEKDSEPAVQLRWLRSQQQTQQLAGTDGDVDMDLETAGVPAADEAPLDPFDLLEPQDVLARLPADLTTRLGSAKWKDRKEVLEETHAVLVKAPRLNATADYLDLVRAFGKCMRDANIQVVQLAANCLELMAKGLRQPFAKYMPLFLGAMLERTKEKKALVTEALSAALDASFAASGLSDVVDETVGACGHKTPQVKVELAKFLARCLATTPVPPTASEVELIMEGLPKLLSDPQAPVRTAAAEAVGTLMKITGERELTQYLGKVDESRMAKVREVYQTCEVKAAAAPPPSRTAPAPARAPAAARTSSGGPGAVAGTARRLMGGAGVLPALAPPSRTLASLLLKKPLNLALIPTKRSATLPLKRSDLQLQGGIRAAPGAGRSGLTTRPLALGQTSTSPGTSSQPRFDSGVGRAERAELEHLRAEQAAWAKEKELFVWQRTEFDNERQRLRQEVESLRAQQQRLLEEHAEQALAVKSKEAQLRRAVGDLEEARRAIQQLQREVLYHQLSAGGAPETQPLDHDILGLLNHNGELNKRVSGLSIDGELGNKENGYVPALPQMFGLEQLGLGDIDTTDESWRRANEVTLQLRARIEKMKARSRSHISNY